MEAGRFHPRAARDQPGRVDLAAPPQICDRRLALVPGDAGSGDWDCAGWITGKSGPLHLPSANWADHRPGLAGARLDGDLAQTAAHPRARGGSLPPLAVPSVVETNDALARHGNTLDVHAEHHAG